MIKNKEYYMNINYDILTTKLSEEDGEGYLAYYKDIKTVMGDGETEIEAIEDVKKAFECFVEVSLQNKDIIPEPIDIEKSQRINVSLSKRRIAGLDMFADKLHTDRSKLIAALADLLLEGKIYVKEECNPDMIDNCFVNLSLGNPSVPSIPSISSK